MYSRVLTDGAKHCNSHMPLRASSLYSSSKQFPQAFKVGTHVIRDYTILHRTHMHRERDVLVYQLGPPLLLFPFTAEPKKKNANTCAQNPALVVHITPHAIPCQPSRDRISSRATRLQVQTLVLSAFEQEQLSLEITESHLQLISPPHIIFCTHLRGAKSSQLCRRS